MSSVSFIFGFWSVQNTFIVKMCIQHENQRASVRHKMDNHSEPLHKNWPPPVFGVMIVLVSFVEGR